MYRKYCIFDIKGRKEIKMDIVICAIVAFSLGFIGGVMFRMITEEGESK